MPTVGTPRFVILFVPILSAPDIVSPAFATLLEIDVVKVPDKSALSAKDVAISASVLRADGAAPTTNSIASCTKAVVAI